MLQLVFGRAASGKSTFLLEKLKECVLAGKETVFIVPEQFSFETEKTILQLLGDEKASKVAVMSFNRLCDEVERICGGMSGRQLTDAGKLILLGRALRDCAPQLNYWKKYIRHQGFISSLLDSIEEFKLNSVLPNDLESAAESINNVALSAKLRDVAQVYSMYNALIEERFIDPSDRLTKLYDKLAVYDYFKDKTVFLDTFKGFTGQQYRILNRIISSSNDVYIALTNDKNNFKRFDVFENIRKTAEDIKRIAKSHSVKIAEDIMLENNFYANCGLASAEEILYSGKTSINNNDESVYLVSASTVYDEAEFVARTIRKLVRTEGYRYKDFVVIARDTAIYEEAFAAACDKNSVNCFIDRRLPLLDFPTVGVVLAAFNAIKNYSTEHIFRFYKSGLDIFSVEELSLLENYTRLWNIDGKQWLIEWTMNPDGLVSGCPEDCDIRLAKINELRNKAIKPIKEFKSSFCGNAEQRSRAIIELLEKCKASNSFIKLSNFFKNQGMPARSEALRQSWDAMMEIFNSMVECYGNAQVEDEDFCNSFKTAAALDTIGVAPQMLDEVSFGAADRIRPSRPKIAMILGANQGVFPAGTSTFGLFGLNDRAKLIELNIPISDRSISSAIDENFLVYTNLCCPTEKLFVCYSALDSANSEKSPSEFVERLEREMNCVKIDAMDYNYAPETVSDTFSLGCSTVLDDKVKSNTLFSALENNAEFSSRIENIISRNNKSDQRLTNDTAKKLYGSEIFLSASKLDVFHKCKFSFFCKYGLKTSKLQPANFDVLQRGTLIHYVLQRLFEEYMENVGVLTDKEISDSVNKYISEYLDSIPGYSGANNPHLIFLIENISRSLKEVANQLRNEFSQSDFKPVYCEFKFGLEDKPPVFIDFNEGKIALNGSIDRVDQWNGYLRIVDYKSGVKNFCLPDILIGQNMQMLLYLYAITRHEEYCDMKSAGIFYMPAKRDKNNNKLSMNGLMLGNEELVKAMDKENNGEFIPAYKLKADGSLYKNSAPSFVKEGDFENIFKFLEGKLKKAGRSLLSGDISVDPINGIDTKACEYCDFRAICGVDEGECKKTEKISTEQVIENIVKEVEDNGI